MVRPHVQQELLLEFGFELLSSGQSGFCLIDPDPWSGLGWQCDFERHRLGSEIVPQAAWFGEGCDGFFVLGHLGILSSRVPVLDRGLWSRRGLACLRCSLVGPLVRLALGDIRPGCVGMARGSRCHLLVGHWV